MDGYSNTEIVLWLVLGYLVVCGLAAGFGIRRRQFRDSHPAPRVPQQRRPS